MDIAAILFTIRMKLMLVEMLQRAGKMEEMVNRQMPLRHSSKVLSDKEAR